jgi:hypothetical protein
VIYPGQIASMGSHLAVTSGLRVVKAQFDGIRRCVDTQNAPELVKPDLAPDKLLLKLMAARRFEEFIGC